MTDQPASTPPVSHTNTLSLVSLLLTLAGGALLVIGALGAETRGFLLVAVMLLVAAFITAIVALTRKRKKKGAAITSLVLSALLGFASPMVFLGSFLSDSYGNTSNAAEAMATAEDGDAGPAVNERGNIVKAVGEEGWFEGANGEKTVSFKITSIERAPACPEQGASTAHGELITLMMEFTTAADYDLQLLQDPRPYWYDFFGVTADGTLTESSAMGLTTCYPMDSILPLELEAGATTTGIFVVDTTPGATAVAWTPGGEPGWEWPVP